MATEVGAAYVELSARTASLEAGLARANAKLVAFSKQADATATRGSAAMSSMGRGVKIATVAVAGGLALAVKSAADFDAQMSQVKAVTNATGKQMDALRSSALKVSASTAGFGYTAKEVAQAQTELGKAGLSVAQIMGGGMKSALTLAKAGNLQLADAAAYTANAMAQFNMAGSQAGQVADAMATAANATTADVGDFGMALVQTGAAAKSAGMSFNATMTALTALAKSGVKGSDAGTSLKTALIQLIKPTTKQEEAARKAGISFLDQNKNMRSLSDISGQLRAKTASMTQAQRTALFATLAGTDGVRTLLALYNAGPGTLAQYSASLGKAGSATRMAATMNDNAAGKFRQLMASLQAAGIQIGNALLPPLAAVASAVAALVGRFSEFKPLAYAAAAAVGVLVAAMAINKVVAFGGAVAQAARSIGLLSAASTAAGAAGSLGAAGTAAGSAAGKMSGLAAAIPAVANPVAALGVAVGLGAAALFMFGKRTDSAAEFSTFLASGLANVRTQTAATTAALTGQAGANQRLIAQAGALKAAKNAETQAVNAYLAAFNKGRAANESEAAFQARLVGLYRQVTAARAQTTTAQNMSNDAVRKSVDNVTKLAGASDREMAAARRRVEQAKAANTQGALLGKTDQQRAKAAAELTESQAQLAVAESRRGQRLKEIEKTQMAAAAAVKRSSLTDAEKAASLDVINRAIAKTREQIKALPEAKTTTIKAKNEATATIEAVKLGLAGLDRLVTVTIRAVKEGVGFSTGGLVRGFATGGMVRGPGGKDRVPAMLTAGEVVLNDRQQRLVNAGMSIDDALRRTGAAFANGKGRKGGSKGGKPKRKPKESDAAYQARVSKWEQANEKVKGAAGNVGQAISAVALKQFDANTGKGLEALQRQSATRMADITRTYQGGVVKVGDSWQRITGSLETADKTQATALKSIEDKYAGLFTALDAEFKTKGAALKAEFDALTPAESQLKALTDAANQSDLAGAVSDAQAKLREAQDFGDPAAIAAARKAVDDAVRAQTIAGLQQTAEAERAQRETDRAAAEAQLQTEYDGRKALLQGYLDGELEAQRVAGETSRMILEAKLAEEQAAEEAALATKQATYEADRENERVRLEARLAAMTAHFEAVRKVGVGKTRGMVKRLNELATDFLASGRNLGDNFADGLKAVLPRIGNVADALAEIIAKYLKTGSPTEKGPMSDLNHWWDGFVPALEQGLDAPALASTISAASSPGAMGAGGGGSTQVINLTVTDSTFAGMSREQADRVARELQAALDRQVRASI